MIHPSAAKPGLAVTTANTQNLLQNCPSFCRRWRRLLGPIKAFELDGEVKPGKRKGTFGRSKVPAMYEFGKLAFGGTPRRWAAAGL